MNAATIDSWSEEDVLNKWPQYKFWKRPVHGGSLFGGVVVGGKLFKWSWSEDGIRKGRNRESLDCPFLLPKQEDGTRPCGLVGTEHEWMFEQACKPHPPEKKSVEDVKAWQERHPDCSYTWK